jgi:hypothetical protein
MRIIGEFDLGAVKASVFKMNERLTVKYEFQLMEQTYKFRDGTGIKSVEDIHKFSQSVEEDIMSCFEIMSKLRWKGIQSLHEVAYDEEDEIV